jgi:dTDP-4-dehydrorhamnose reductase
MQVAEFFNLDSSLISECSSSFFKSLAPRPKNTSFKCDKLTTDFGIIPFTFLEGLKTMKKLYRSEDL